LDSFDDAPCALARTDGQGVLTMVNTAFCEWLGYAPEQLVGKRRLQDLFTVGGKIFHQTHWLPLLQIQGSVAEVRMEMVHQDGRRVPMIFNAIRRERAGQVMHDIAAFVATDRDKFEQELVAARKKLEATLADTQRLEEIAKDRALFAEQMVGIVSHDLRNPLATIAMSAELLERGELLDKQRQVLGRITKANGRAERLISTLLDFTQARLGQGLSVSPRLLDAHKLVAEAVDELSQAFPARELRHVRQGDGVAFIDADRLSQLIGNLVSNAVTYGTPSSPVTVTSFLSEAGMVVSVHNAGPAIPDEYRDRLFHPLVRGGDATNTGGSVGLGLYIVSEIAKAHGGTVGVTSEPNAGTRFTATFPSKPPGV
jgi:sigma-B regulation protein RsbU (phosphoserine phosphatase)